jgi:hypothetical protein
VTLLSTVLTLTFHDERPCLKDQERGWFSCSKESYGVIHLREWEWSAISYGRLWSQFLDTRAVTNGRETKLATLELTKVSRPWNIQAIKGRQNWCYNGNALKRYSLFPSSTKNTGCTGDSRLSVRPSACFISKTTNWTSTKLHIKVNAKLCWRNLIFLGVVEINWPHLPRTNFT